MKNREHKVLVEAMETTLKRVVLLAGVPQRLLGKVAIVTGQPVPYTHGQAQLALWITPTVCKLPTTL